jgi:hypothetical protein
MNKLYEFINNNESLLKLLDSFLFYDEKWLFVENRDFFIDEVDNNEIEKIIEIGLKIANNLNRLNISPDDYNEKEILNYLKDEII